MIRWNRFFFTILFGLATFAAGCAARDVDVSQRGPIRGEATVEGDRSTSTTESDQNRRRSSGSTSSGSVSGSGSATGSGSASGSVTRE